MGDARHVTGLVGKLLNAFDELFPETITSDNFKSIVSSAPPQLTRHDENDRINTRGDELVDLVESARQVVLCVFDLQSHAVHLDRHIDHALAQNAQEGAIKQGQSRNVQHLETDAAWSKEVGIAQEPNLSPAKSFIIRRDTKQIDTSHRCCPERILHFRHSSRHSD